MPVLLHQDFLPDLKDHILSRLLDVDIDHSFTDDERDGLQIVGNQLYHHGTLRVNYTTYDMRRNQDSINPKTHPDILMLAPSSQLPHPYLYGRVIGIYHVDIIHANLSPHSQRIEFLHVRFFQVDEGFQGGFKSRRFYRLSFAKADDAGAFGFVDPARVIRGIHIIPAFAYPITDELLGESIARVYTDVDAAGSDWKYYYVNM